MLKLVYMNHYAVEYTCVKKANTNLMHRLDCNL